jgi:hypothetical protein
MYLRQHAGILNEAVLTLAKFTAKNSRSYIHDYAEVLSSIYTMAEIALR